MSAAEPRSSGLGNVRDRTDDDAAAAILDVRIRYAPSLPLVRLVGELDVGSAHLLTDAIESLAATQLPAEMVVLDLAEVRFCDIAGLRAIQWCSTALAATGMHLVLYHPPDAVTKLIAMSGMAAGVTIRG
jgi:anti-anti-sigma factor